MFRQSIIPFAVVLGFAASAGSASAADCSCLVEAGTKAKLANIEGTVLLSSATGLETGKSGSSVPVGTRISTGSAVSGDLIAGAGCAVKLAAEQDIDFIAASEGKACLRVVDMGASELTTYGQAAGGAAAGAAGAGGAGGAAGLGGALGAGLGGIGAAGLVGIAVATTVAVSVGVQAAADADKKEVKASN